MAESVDVMTVADCKSVELERLLISETDFHCYECDLLYRRYRNVN